MIAMSYTAFVIALSMQATGAGTALAPHEARFSAAFMNGAALAALPDLRGAARNYAHASRRHENPLTLTLSPTVGKREHEVRRDEWLGNDKLRHFLMSMAVTQFAYGGLRTASADDDVALPIAIGAAAVVGVGKEVYDVRNAGPFSLKDLTWDAAGIIVAGLILGSVR